jgi:hypothetical protein
VEDVPITWRTESFLTRNFPEDLVPLIKSSVIYDAPGWATFVTRMTQAVTAASVAALLLWASLPSDRGRMEVARRLNIVVAVTVAGVLANAVICGVLASPYGRFQARVVWLLPLLVFLTVAVRLRRAAKPERSPREAKGSEHDTPI